ncbi:MAG: carboxypeptidase-like regulatory domain-containing protein, partial [Candidatus Zixiibacteriota bacterium]
MTVTTKIPTTLLTLIVCATIAQATAFADGTRISATVTDLAGAPIPGATVLVFQDSTMLKGTATDTQGHFSLHLNVKRHQHLRISAVGYRTVELNLSAESPLPTRIALVEKVVDVGAIAVAPETDERLLSVRKQSSEAVRRAAQQSLVPTNPLAGIH